MIEVLSVTSELFPLIKTGGLADVAGALPVALKREDVHIRTLIPGYPGVRAALKAAEAVAEIDDLMGRPATILAADGVAGGLDLLVIDAPHLFDRPGNPYLGPDGSDWPDNAQRFAALSLVAAMIGQGLVSGYDVDVVHGHDWQAGLAPAYLALSGRPRPATVMTVHNIAFQGQAAPNLLDALHLPSDAFHVDGLEYYGTIGTLKAGLNYADMVTTVSPTYAEEILTPVYGMGLDGLLRKRRADLVGIVNGIDEEIWNPASDPHLAATYSATSPAPRAANKAWLQKRMGLEVDPDATLFCAVTRLTWQKGMDVLLDVLPHLVRSGGQFALLGAGDPGLEAGFVAATLAWHGRVGCVMGYDEPLSHQLQGGSDAILVPSRFEPCGLTQLYGLRYGCVPVVARTGGLADTVIDANDAALADGVSTGIQFGPVNNDALSSAISRTIRLHREPGAFETLQRRGMTRPVGWERPARQYAALYKEAIQRSKAVA